MENYAAVLDEVLRAKPSAAKGKYLRKVILTTTMGPGVPVDPNLVKNLREDTPTPEPTVRSDRGAATRGGAPARLGAMARSSRCGWRTSGSVPPARAVGAAGRQRADRPGRGGGRAGPQRRGQVHAAPARRGGAAARPGPGHRPPGRVGWVPERFPADQPFTVARYLTAMARVRGCAAPRPTRRWPLDRPARASALPRRPAGRAVQGLRAEGRPRPGPARPPGLLVLDEPWEGLDAATRELVPELDRRGARRRRVGAGQRPPRRDRPAAGARRWHGRRRSVVGDGTRWSRSRCRRAGRRHRRPVRAEGHQCWRSTSSRRAADRRPSPRAASRRAVRDRRGVGATRGAARGAR